MGESVDYKRIKEFALEKDKQLTATEKGFNRTSSVVCDDGSHFLVDSAFLFEKDDWIILFAEHYPPMIFHKEDVVNYKQFERVG